MPIAVLLSPTALLLSPIATLKSPIALLEKPVAVLPLPLATLESPIAVLTVPPARLSVPQAVLLIEPLSFPASAPPCVASPQTTALACGGSISSRPASASKGASLRLLAARSGFRTGLAIIPIFLPAPKAPAETGSKSRKVNSDTRQQNTFGPAVRQQSVLKSPTFARMTASRSLSRLKKYSDFPKSQISFISVAVPSLRGALRNVTKRGAGCGRRGQRA
jgi:hypothetical protein